MWGFPCGFVLHYLSLFQTDVKCVIIYNNTFDVIFVIHLFTCQKGSKNHQKHTKGCYLVIGSVSNPYPNNYMKEAIIQIVNPKVILTQSIKSK